MMKHQIKNKGFALFEILVVTLILCGAIYIFLSQTQQKQQKINDQIVGKHLSMVINDFLDIAGTPQCGISPTDYPFSHCVTMSDQFNALLVKDGFDTSNITVSFPSIDNVSITFPAANGGKFDVLAAKYYADQININRATKSRMALKDVKYELVILNPTTGSNAIKFTFSISNNSPSLNINVLLSVAANSVQQGSGYYALSFAGDTDCSSKLTPWQQNGICSVQSLMSTSSAYYYDGLTYKPGLILWGIPGTTTVNGTFLMNYTMSFHSGAQVTGTMTFTVNNGKLSSSDTYVTQYWKHYDPNNLPAACEFSTDPDTSTLQFLCGD